MISGGFLSGLINVLSTPEVFSWPAEFSFAHEVLFIHLSSCIMSAMQIVIVSILQNFSFY